MILLLEEINIQELICLFLLRIIILALYFLLQNNLFGSNNKQIKFSYDEKEKSEEDLVIKKNQDKAVKKYYIKNNLPNFKLKSRSPKYNDIKIITFEELQMKNKLEKKKLKKINMLEELLKNKPDIKKTSTNLKFNIDQERELE